MDGKAKLVGKVVVPMSDTIEWAKWMENPENRIVRRDEFDNEDGHRVLVSTVFLGLDHSYRDNKSLWFETMINRNGHWGYQERYTTYDEAVEGHERALEMAKQGEYE